MTQNEALSDADFEGGERTLKEQLLRLYYLRKKLEAQGAAEVPSVAHELARLQRRSDELVLLWASLRRERSLRAAERLLEEATDEARLADALLDRLRDALEQRSAERSLQRELRGL